MTSRISFSDLLKEEMKHQMVSIFVVIFVFVSDLLFFYFDVQSHIFVNDGYATSMIEGMASPDFNDLLPSIALAIILAANSFSYLHSRKKTDFYMSLPVKRNTRFALGMVSGILIFLISCAIETVMEIGIVLSTGYITGQFLRHMMWMFLFKCLAFAATWVTMTLSVVVTGHFVVAVMGFVAFCAYVPLILYELYPTFATLFYENFYRIGYEEMPWYFFSPISLLGSMCDHYDLHMGEFRCYLIATVLFIGVVGVAAWRLYLHRFAEAAGRAMAFEKANAAIRVLLVIPLALYCGYFLEAMSMTESKIWLLVGTIVGSALLHGVMESIFEFDLKHMVTKKKQWLVTTAVCVGILGGFYFTADIYDAYVPNAEEVASAQIVLFEDSVRLYDIGNVEGFHDEQVQALLALAERIVIRDPEELEQGTEPEDYTIGTMYVKYKMTNGKAKGRCYKVCTSDVENRKLLDQIIGTEDFKDDYFSIYEVPDDVVREIEIGNSFDSEKLWLSDEEKTEFLNIYRKELAELTFTEMKQELRCAQISMKYEYEYGAATWEDNCFIYENFDETIKFLEEHGISVGNPLDQCEILSIQLEEERDESGEPLYVISDSEAINRAKGKMAIASLYGYGYVDRIGNSQYAHAEVQIDNRVERTYLYIADSEAEILKKAAD